MRTLIWLAGVLSLLVAVPVLFHGGVRLQRYLLAEGPGGLRVWREVFWQQEGALAPGGRAILTIVGGYLGAVFGYRLIRLAGRMG